MKRFRGLGGTYKRGGTWWVHYSIRGVIHRESARSSEQKDAIKLLKKRIGDAANGKVIGPKSEHVTLRDLLDALIADTAKSGTARCAGNPQREASRRYFSEHTKVVAITRARINRRSSIAVRSSSGAT